MAERPPNVVDLASEREARLLLADAFAAMDIDVLRSCDAVVDEGPGHSGMSALIDLVATKRT